jgi:hypothetical protein
MVTTPRSIKEPAVRSMTGRTVAITAVAVLLGGGVLYKGFHKPAKLSTNANGTTQTIAPKSPTTVKGAPTTTVTTVAGGVATTAPPIVATTLPVNASVALLVANGAEKAGIAGRVGTILQTKGYSGVLSPATNATAVSSTSAVYFTAGNDRLAGLVGKDLKIAAVTAMPPTAPVKELRSAGILVVLGTDFDEAAIPKDNALKGTAAAATPGVTAATVATVAPVPTAVTTPAKATTAVAKATTTTVKK